MKYTRVVAVLMVMTAGVTSAHAADQKDVVTPPGYAYKPNFGDYYPPASRIAEEQGLVKIRICYDVKGKVQVADVAESSGHARLDEAAVRAGRDVVIKPGTINRIPQAGCVILPAKFSLKDTAPAEGGVASSQGANGTGKQAKTRATAELTYLPDTSSYYPRESKKAGEEGTAVVVVCYDTKGKIISSELHSSSGFARLDEAAVSAGHKIRLDPAIRDGVSQAGCGVVPLKFSLKR